MQKSDFLKDRPILSSGLCVNSDGQLFCLHVNSENDIIHGRYKTETHPKLVTSPIQSTVRLYTVKVKL